MEQKIYNIVIYSNCSLGGCFEYAKKIAQTFSNKKEVKNVYALFPKNAEFESLKNQENNKQIFYNILKSDKPFKTGISLLDKFISKIYFIYRCVKNPLFAINFAKKHDADIFILNDFDQVSAFFWTKKFSKQLFTKAIILHDPDRSAYFRLKSLSTSTMNRIVDACDFAFYHNFLPSLPYYKDKQTIFEAIPHGFYPPKIEDEQMKNYIFDIKNKGYKVLSISGNIRKEKNYFLAMDAIKEVENAALLICGVTVTSKENIEDYKQYAKTLGIEDRVFFVNQYLSQNQMTSIFKYSDIVLLYYAKSFTSQSGILNSLLVFRPKLIVSNCDSAMATVAKEFEIAMMVAPDNKDALKQAIIDYPEENPYEKGWENFEKFSSWENNINIQMHCYKNL